METLSAEELKDMWAAHFNYKYPPEAFVVFPGKFFWCSLMLKSFVPLKERQNKNSESFCRRGIREQTKRTVGGHHIDYLSPQGPARKIIFLALYAAPVAPKSALESLVTQGLLKAGDCIYEDSFGPLANDAPDVETDVIEVGTANLFDVVTTMEASTENHFGGQSNVTEVVTEMKVATKSHYGGQPDPMDVDDPLQHSSLATPRHAAQIEPILSDPSMDEHRSTYLSIKASLNNLVTRVTADQCLGEDSFVPQGNGENNSINVVPLPALAPQILRMDMATNLLPPPSYIGDSSSAVTDASSNWYWASYAPPLPLSFDDTLPSPGHEANVVQYLAGQGVADHAGTASWQESIYSMELMDPPEFELNELDLDQQDT